MNVTFGIRYAKRYIFKVNYQKFNKIDETQSLAKAYPIFEETLLNDDRSKDNYIFFIDTLNFSLTVKKLYYLDSLAGTLESINFVVATDGSNSRILQYLKRYDIHFDNLIFREKLNYLHSAISNHKNQKFKMNNSDLILDRNGVILYNPGLKQQNTNKELELFLEKRKKNRWQKTIN